MAWSDFQWMFLWQLGREQREESLQHFTQLFRFASITWGPIGHRGVVTVAVAGAEKQHPCKHQVPTTVPRGCSRQPGLSPGRRLRVGSWLWGAEPEPACVGTWPSPV